MALTPSNMLLLGTQASPFSLPCGKGQIHHSDDLFKENGLLVVFMSNHCPYVIHLADALAKMGDKIADFDIGMVGINANDVVAYPADSPENMIKECEDRGYHFPYLFDESQEVAKAYQAACTPDFFLFDGDKKLVYRGQFDGSSPGNDTPVTGSDLYAALEALGQGRAIDDNQQPSIGCNIKWK